MIPAYNEETTVAGVVYGHREVGRRLAGTIGILVCDEGSADGTAAARAGSHAHSGAHRAAQQDQSWYRDDHEAA